MSLPQAGILRVGDELLGGRIVDTNAAFLANQLTDAGFAVVTSETVGDEEFAIVDALENMAGRVDLLIMCGGLGPTPDDVTREALAGAAGTFLVTDKKLKKEIAERTGSRAPRRNARMARLPDGATPIPNTVGSAPGIRMKIRGAQIHALPGVPIEMEAMFREAVLPELQETFVETESAPRRVLKVFGPREAEVAEKLGDLLERGKDPAVGVTVRHGVITITVVGKGAGKRADAIRGLLKKNVFAESETSLAEVVIGMLREREMTLATAESVTGGMVASSVIEVAGASEVLRGGVVAYSDDLKRMLLDIPATVLKREGAVSAEVAGRMAKAVRKKCGASVGLATTGVAGPDRDSSGTPVGRIFCAVSTPKGKETVKRFAFRGDRNAIRRRAARAALDLLRRTLK